MHGSGGQFLLLLFLVGLSAGVLARTVERARAAHRGTTATSRRPRIIPVPGLGWLEHRRRIALEREKHRLGVLRDYAKHRMRMREREAAAPATAAAPDAPAAGAPGAAQPQGTDAPRERPRRRVVPGFVIRTAGGRTESRPAEPQQDRPRQPGAPASPAPPQEPSQPGRNTMPDGTKYVTVGPGGDGSPGRSPYGPPLPFLGSAGDPVTGPQARPHIGAGSPSPGGSTVSSGAVEQAVEGTQHIHARAAAGNIRAKQWAIKACAELFTRISAMMLMLSRTLAEQRYGPEITEPLAQASQFAQAAALACGQSDASITSLANMTVGELADSPRQAPHHSQLEENGAR